MAAPIQRYSDPRLNGSALTAPFLKAAYQFRSAKVFREKLDALVKMAKEGPNALVGRARQIKHYHSLPEEKREHPEVVRVADFALPQLKSGEIKEYPLYLGGEREKIEAIVEKGFDPEKTRKSALLADGVYLTPNKETAKAYGEEQLVVSLKVRPGEIAYLDPTALALFQFEHRQILRGPKGYEQLPALFLKNGYKGVEYDLFDWKKGVSAQRALVVYDPSCITIRKPSSSE